MSSTQPGPDSVVTVKVNYDGVTRRAKMHLREMVPHLLERQIRSFLHISDDAEPIIERYSDSAAAYVRLDPENASVYKQLYRAAKAKSKLKLRVTLKGQEEKPAPKPVTVEDEPEMAASTNKLTPTEAKQLQEAVPPYPTLHREAKYPIRPRPAAESGPVEPPRSSTEQTAFVQDFENRLASLLRGKLDLANELAVQSQVTRKETPPCAKTSAPPKTAPFVPVCSRAGVSFAVCCNSCEKTMPDVHYHCSTCEDGDFDLCKSCVELGITCHSNDHWLIKRMNINGQIVNSTTETIAPKSKKGIAKKEVPAAQKVPSLADKDVFANPNQIFQTFDDRWTVLPGVRTCNACVQELPEREFLHCASCDDFDLCLSCFPREVHSHHPKHAFTPAVPGTSIPDQVKSKMGPGRDQTHHAICDGCDKYVSGVRHKCLDCPDWDYCSECIPNASFIHPGHRFVAVYEPLPELDRVTQATHSIHVGICCDGPLCSLGKGYPSYIRGTRYKCAVCHDLDFCGNCEASPANKHNKTHPLIKFKTPVRHVSVTTTGEHQGGQRMPAMGDRENTSTSSRATATEPAPSVNTIKPVETVVNVEPKEVEPEIKTEAEPEIKEEKVETDEEQEPNAVFVRDSVSDGTIMAPNHVFEQTWTLRNDGDVAWPAGCSVKFVSGDYMGHVDSSHPAGVPELISASESTVCYAPVAPGQEVSFTVLLRTPARMGRVISFWRLTTPKGIKFGHRLWCEVNVRAVEPEVEEEEEEEELKLEEQLDEPTQEPQSETSSQMIFPKLEKESPDASIHEPVMDTGMHAETKSVTDLEDNVDDAEWEDSDDGFLTDEEYDVLDASDEEYLEQQQNQPLKK